MYRQFKNAAWDCVIKKKTNKLTQANNEKTKKNKNKNNENKTKAKKRKKEITIWAIPVPNCMIKDVICCSNGHIYHFLDYIKLLLFVNANVIHHV